VTKSSAGASNAWKKPVETSQSLETYGVLHGSGYRNFQSVIESARTACFNSGQRVDDHFVEVTEMVEIGSGAQRSLKTVMMSRYACYTRKTNW